MMSIVATAAVVQFSGFLIFWFLGVNFRLQSLQYRILLIPICLVTLFPLLIVLVEPQPGYGHLNGLPLGIAHHLLRYP